MPTTPAEIKALFPRFDCLNDSQIQSWIDFANDVICKSAYLTTAVADRAEQFFVAHFLELYEMQADNVVGVHGPATEMSGGDLSLKYGAAMSDPTFFDSTKFGAVYNRLSVALFPSRVFSG